MIVMKKLMKPKIVWGLLVLVVISSLLVIKNVKAEEVITGDEAKKICDEFLPSIKYLSRYNVTFDEKSAQSNRYVIKMNPTSSDKNLEKALRKVKFKVILINGQGVSENMELAYGKPLEVEGKFIKDDSEDGLGIDIMRVTLEATETNSDPKCLGKVSFTVQISKAGVVHYISENVGTVQEADFGDLTQSINCDKSYDANSFEGQFCHAKKEAQKTPVYQNSSSKLINFTDKFNDNMTFAKLVGEKTTSKFQCDYKTLHKEEDSVGDNYYVNKSYLYGSGTVTHSYGNYKYHFSPDTVTEGDAAKCKVKCEEAVTVEYGPPVASKAGLCFEYKIKVTSRVSCSMTEKPTPPKTPSDVCTPTPVCAWSGHGSQTITYAGPNEEFDNCIRECDGGKYTDHCNQKCYNKVYGKKGVNKSTNVLNLQYTEKLADTSSLDACVRESAYGGCYYKSGSDIYWKTNSNAPGRWYVVTGFKSKLPGWKQDRLSVKPGTGFYQYRYKNGDGVGVYGAEELCQDACWWSGCGGNVYLNPGQAEKDKQQNETIYNNAVAACKAAASCNSSTATFTISVDYSHNTKDGVKDVTIDFPYSKQEDKLASLGVGNSGANTSDANNTTLLGYNGCYKDKNNERWYQAEWSFPGTWINNKTGEITYVNKNNDKGWQTMKNKFCIPLDAKDVNQKWWAYYYNTMLKGKKSSTDSEAYKDNCGNNSDSITNRTTPAAPDKWNIRGKTFKFGYYDWNLEAECFYALNSNPANVPKSDKKATEKCSTDLPEDKVTVPNYRVRPVDLTNMFPATDGSKTTGSNGNGTTTGRSPGYNWTEYANNTKNPAFSSTPSRYVSKVQELGYTVYSDNSLDYEFVLTTDILRKMRDKTKNKNKNYTKYEGKSEVSELGVVNYKSSELRTGDLSSATKKLPTEKGRLCNNMVNYSSSLCDSN